MSFSIESGSSVPFQSPKLSIRPGSARNHGLRDGDTISTIMLDSGNGSQEVLKVSIEDGCLNIKIDPKLLAELMDEEKQP